MARIELEDDFFELARLKPIGQKSSYVESVGSQSHRWTVKWIFKVIELDRNLM